MTAQPAPNPPGAARTPGTWYAHDITTNDNRPVWHSEVRVDVGPAAYQTVALCRSLTNQRADAEYIARTVNSFGPLVEALERIHTCWGHGYKDKDLLLKALGELIEEDARAALNLARGAQPGRAGAALGEGEG